MAIGSLNKGKTFSASTIESMKKSVLDRIKPIYSAKGIKNMKKNIKGILVYNMDFTVYGEFHNITSGAGNLGCRERSIIRALKTEKKLLNRRLIIKSLDMNPVSKRSYSTTSNLTSQKLNPN